MSRLLPLIAALVIAIRPFAGCCECHAPLLAGLEQAWHEIWSQEHTDECCQHSSGSDHDHDRGKCPSCESTSDFVKIAGPQVAKATSTWHFAEPLAADERVALTALGSRSISSGGLACPGLRAHLVLGVMLI
jgi:hypothetical protein